MNVPESVLDPRKGCTSASNAQADSLCPGRHRAQAGIPETASPDAELGRRIHAALAKNESAGLTIEETDTYDAAKGIEAQLVADFFGNDVLNAGVFMEHRFWGQSSGPPQVEHSAQVDVTWWLGGKALVIERKSLWGDIPESPRNLQLRDQAVLVRRSLKVVSAVGVVVVQPKVSHKPDVCLYTAEDLDRAEQEMWRRVVASNDPAAPRIAGAEQCKYCRAKATCDAYTRWAGTLLPAPQSVFSKSMATWTPEDRAAAAALLAPASKALDEIKDFLKGGLAVDPAFVPGWKLDGGSTRETITDPQACFDRCSQLGVTLPQFMGAINVLKTRLKEIVHEATKKKGKALEAELSKITEGIVKETKAAPSLTRVKE
jgi:Protein of unknown function (DUF2800)